MTDEEVLKRLEQVYGHIELTIDFIIKAYQLGENDGFEAAKETVKEWYEPKSPW